MRKHTTFAIAATMLVLAATFCVKSGVLDIIWPRP